MSKITKLPLFLSDAWRRKTYFSRGALFPFSGEREGARGKDDKGKRESQGRLALSQSLNLNAPSLRPPVLMTTPHHITLRQTLDDHRSEERLVPKAFWRKSAADKKIEKELKAAGISFDEYLQLKKGRVGFTLMDMYIHARARRNKQTPFWVRTPKGGLARISSDKIIYFAPGKSFNVQKQYAEELKFLWPYLAKFQHVHTAGPSYLQKLFHDLMINYNRRYDLTMTHQPTYQAGEAAELVSRLNVEAGQVANKWLSIALRHGHVPRVPSVASAPKFEPELTPAPSIRPR